MVMKECGWWMEKVEEQSREVAWFCYEKKEKKHGRVWEVATLVGCLHDDAGHVPLQTHDKPLPFHFDDWLMSDDSSSSEIRYQPSKRSSPILLPPGPSSTTAQARATPRRQPSHSHMLYELGTSWPSQKQHTMVFHHSPEGSESFSICM